MFLEYLLIFFARVLDVSLSTVRMLLIVRCKKYPAAVIGFLEATIYIVALSRIMQNLNDPYKILVYGLGFASGTLLGGYLEERLAIGHVALQVIPADGTSDELLKALRTTGYGVTVQEGKGMTGAKAVLLVSTDRKTLARLTSLIEEFSPGSFVTVLETRDVVGGMIPYRKSK
jgi:uncharacterized protein YebE (UPF0316 family)